MAKKLNLVIDKGADFSTTIPLLDDNGVPVDLTGYTASAKLAKHYTSVTKYNFVVSVNASLGTVSLSLPKSNTSVLASGQYVYDCELTTNANVTSRLVEGIVTVTPSVTT